MDVYKIIPDEESIYKVPNWAKDAVWYQIFPERFRNGNPSVNPTLEDIKEGEIKNWKISEWTSDWYEIASWEHENFNSIFQSIFMRRYGGDLQGILDKLDYLKDLGITAIYLNPIFRAPSLHKYDTSCYHHIDETLGPDPEGDRKLVEQANETDDPSTWVFTKADMLLLELIKEIHSRNMKLILDGVFNHSGRYTFAFQDILKNGRKSKYSSWYSITRWDPSLPDGFRYKGWAGFQYLPEFRRDKDNVNENYKEYIFNVTRRWMAPYGHIEDGIDGWRLDVAFCLPHGFWKEWRKHVKSINPEAYLTAEVVTISPEYLHGDEFDAMMNYPFAVTAVEYFIDKKNKISASMFDKKLQLLRESYSSPVTYVMQNLFSSHDTPRTRSLIVNPDLNYRDWAVHSEKSKVEKNPNYRIDRGTEEHRDIHKLMVIFQMTYVGAPMVYYGDEVGMTGANDPDCRKPMIWEDLEYKDEKAHPVKTCCRPFEKNYVDRDLLEHYKKMIRIRNENPSLRRGSYKTILTDDEKDIFCFLRECEGEKILVVLNNSNIEQKVKLDITSLNCKEAKFVDILNGNKEYIVIGNLKLEIKSKWAAVLRDVREITGT
jgi:glycosidase